MEVKLTQRGEITSHRGAIREIKIHSSGKFFFARSDQMLVIYDLNSLDRLHGFYGSAGFSGATFTADYSSLMYQTDEKVHYFDLNHWNEKLIVTGEIFENRDHDAHPGKGLYADGNESGVIEVRKLGADDIDPPDYTLEGHKNFIEYVQFFPTGAFLASGSADKTIKFWDLESRTEISSFEIHNDFVTAIAFSADGKYMISGDYSGDVKIWDISVSE
jgi:WD40 repeat protein